MFRFAFISMTGLLLAMPRPAHGLDQAELAALLAKPILDPHCALDEVQRFTETRVPRVPPARTADEWRREAKRIRTNVLNNVVFRGQAAAWRDAPLQVEWLETIKGGPGYHIRKLRYEAVPGLWIPALLYEPSEISGKAAVSLNVNGHEAKGKAADYKQVRCINQAKRGILALNLEWLGMGQLAGENNLHYRMNQLDLCGTSGLAPFFLAIQRGLDVLLSHPHADPARVAVSGLSGGGWQTIMFSSLDERVTLANPVAGYSSFRTRARHTSDLGDSEQTPNDLALYADYDHLTALLAPRAALLTYNAKDNCCFQADHALPPLLEAARPIYRLFGREDRLRAHVNTDPGTHNFERDNREAFYRILADEGFFAARSRDAAEIPSEDEVRTPDELNVALPEGNADLHSLALGLANDLPRAGALVQDKAAAMQWQAESRDRLAQLVRAPRYNVEAKCIADERHGEISARFWRFDLDGAWTLPVVEFATAEAKDIVVIVGDSGRSLLAADVERFLAQGKRVVVFDPFYYGESKIESHDFLYALLVSAVGERPLGIQAGQLAAVAHWAQAQSPSGTVTLAAIGPRTSLAALVASGMDDGAIELAIDAVELTSPLGSLKEVLDRNGSVTETPEVFCFGLLEQFDIVHLAALAAPRPVLIRSASDRARREFAALGPWYELWGAQFGPVE